MKAFRFRLEQARRWREAQFTLQQARVASAAARAADAQAELEAAGKALREGAAQLLTAPSSDVFSVYAGFTRRAAREEGQKKQQVAAARQTLSAEIQSMTQARRRLRLLEDMKDAERARWQREFDRETGAFADEMFLAKLRSSRRDTIGKDGAGA